MQMKMTHFFINIAFFFLKKVFYDQDHTLKNMCTKFHGDWLNSLLMKE